MVKLSTLSLHKDNPRHISEQNLKNLADSIKKNPEFMELKPIIYHGKEKVIIGGNQRYRALISLGYKEVPDNWVKEAPQKLTEKKIKEFVVIDNSPKGMSGIWDFVILQDHYSLEDLQELQMTEFIETKVKADDPAKEFTGMPEFVQEEQPVHRKLLVYFDNDDDYYKFAKIIDRNLTAKTKYIWYPDKDFDQMDRDNAFVAETEEE